MNLRPSGYEPDELPDCSTPRQVDDFAIGERVIMAFWGTCVNAGISLNPF